VAACELQADNVAPCFSCSGCAALQEFLKEHKLRVSVPNLPQGPEACCPNPPPTLQGSSFLSFRQQAGCSGASAACCSDPIPGARGGVGAGVQLVIRSHEGPDAREKRPEMAGMRSGYTEDHTVESGRLVTLFSAPDYPQFQVSTPGLCPGMLTISEYRCWAQFRHASS